jgi:hypothetical protein
LHNLLAPLGLIFEVAGRACLLDSLPEAQYSVT